MDSSVSPKDEMLFLCVCHHISTGLYIVVALYWAVLFATLELQQTAGVCVCVCVCACVRVSLGGVSVEFKITALLMCAACTVNMLPVRTLEELAG